MTIHEAIRTCIAGRDLTEEAAGDAAREIMSGEVGGEAIAALLVALRMKGETVAEITGFVRAMRCGATRVPIDSEGLIDTCGTGGDGAGTFNISTVAALVAAGAGCKVAKHGNRSNSSKSGSSDVLRALDVNTEMTPERTAECIERIGIGFLFAPQYHPGARHAGSARKAIGARTIFNTIGPLVHPAGAKRQVMGIYDGRLTEPVAEVLRRLGSVHCLVVHGDDGLDEITISGPTRISELKDAAIHSYTVAPEQFGIERASIEAIRGGEPEENARITRSVLAGEKGPRRDVVVLNAGAVIYAGGVAHSMEDGVAQAARAIDSGAATQKLEALVAAG